MFSFSVTLLMLNILIAIIGSSYGNYTRSAESLLRQERYNIMISMQRGMSLGQQKLVLENYSIGEVMDIDGVEVAEPVAPIVKKQLPKIKPGAVYPMEEATAAISAIVTGMKPFDITGSTDVDDDSDDEIEDNDNVEVQSWTTAHLDRFSHYFKSNTAKEQEIKKFSTIRWNYKWEVTDSEWFTKKSEAPMVADASNVKIILLIIDPQNDFHDDPALVVNKIRDDSGKVIRTNISGRLP